MPPIDNTLQLKSRIDELERKIQSLNFDVNKTINFFDIFGLFNTSLTVPVGKPNSPQEQIIIYTNSTTYRLYWYDSVASVWHYVTATA